MGSPSNAAFASDLTAIIKKWKPDYWVHGHVHHFLDYLEDETRIISNARGYFHEREVNCFRPGFVIEI
jgi:Icc-related predicted phosphoesterase